MFFQFGGHEPSRQAAPPQPPPPKPSDHQRLYQALGLDRTQNPTADDVKRAFRTLARTKHPDKGGDAQAFQVIQEAYEVLSDDARRQRYDAMGEASLKDGAGGPGTGPGGGGGAVPPEFEHLFQMFGGAFGGGGGGPRQQQQQPPQQPRTRDVGVSVSITLADVCRGATQTVVVPRQELCPTCSGRGGTGDAVRCGPCSGRGATMEVTQIGPGMLQQRQVACSTCSGRGSVRPKDRQCVPCGGAGTRHNATRSLNVTIPVGAQHGQQLVMAGASDESPGATTGNVIVVVQVAEDPVWERCGGASHLSCRIRVTLAEALLGWRQSVQHPDGRTLILESRDRVTAPGSVGEVPGEGLPRADNPLVRGHVFVRVSVAFPESLASLTDEDRRCLERVLGGGGPADKKTEDLGEVCRLHASSVEAMEQACRRE